MPCTVCDSTSTRSVVSIESVPVYCNVLWPSRRQAVSAAKGTIELEYCLQCGHFFNRDFDVGKTDYSVEYENSLHFSPRFNQYAESLADRLIETYDLEGADIVEIGCGKGDFLALLCSQGRNRGCGFDKSFEPGRREQESSDSITFVQDFYGPRYSHLPVDFICCRHVLEHIDRPTEFLRELRGCLADRTEVVLYFEVPNALFTIQGLGIWDLIYEHCSYFSRQSLQTAFAMAGFEVLTIAEAFGGQYLQVEARPTLLAKGRRSAKSLEIGRLLLDTEAFERRFRERVESWDAFLERHRTERTVIWGGGSKGVTFLNLLSGARWIDSVVDINPHKQGRFVPGAGHEVIDPSSLVEGALERVIVMNDLYAEEIVRTLTRLGIEADVRSVQDSPTS